MGPGSVGASSGGGGGTTFSSSSLNALQAISEGVGASLPSTLTSPSTAHKPDCSPSVHSSSSSSQPPCKPGHGDSKSPAGAYSHGPGDQHHPLHHHHHHSHTHQAESSSADRPDSQAGGGSKESGEATSDAGNASSEPPRKIPDGKGHKKLLQLLTSPTEELGLGVGSGPPGPPTGGNLEGKEPGCVTSPSSVSSSTNQSQVLGAAGGGPSEALGSSHYTASLQKKHKILHKLLQNGNTPDEVAKITAEATGKAVLGQEAGAAGGDVGGSNAGPGGVSGTSEPKQEQHSPKEKKTNALLHYLLNNKDDSNSKETSDIKPKPEDLEGKGITGGNSGTPLSRGAQENMEGKIKSEPPDEVNLCHF